MSSIVIFATRQVAVSSKLSDISQCWRGLDASTALWRSRAVPFTCGEYVYNLSGTTKFSEFTAVLQDRFVTSIRKDPRVVYIHPVSHVTTQLGVTEFDIPHRNINKEKLLYNFSAFLNFNKSSHDTILFNNKSLDISRYNLNSSSVNGIISVPLCPVDCNYLPQVDAGMCAMDPSSVGNKDLTRAVRCLPSFIIAGAMKCGTGNWRKISMLFLNILFLFFHYSLFTARLIFR